MAISSIMIWVQNIVDESKIVDLSYIDDFPRVEIPELTRIDPLGMAGIGGH